MTINPGADSERDAGLVHDDQDEPLTLVQEAAGAPAVPADPEDHAPSTARPDLRGEATEADVLDQAASVPTDEDDLR